MKVHLHSVLDDFQMLRDYATRHALASQKGQRETVASVQTVPRKQGRDPPENTATQATERVGGEARTTPEKLSRGEQMRDLFRVPHDGTPQTRAPHVCHHLSSSGESQEPQVPLTAHEDVLLQTAYPRSVPVHLLGHSVWLRTLAPKKGMEVSSLPNQSQPRGVTILSSHSQHASASCSRPCPKGVISQVSTLLVPLRCRSQWDCLHDFVHWTFFRLLYLHLSHSMYVIEEDSSSIMIPCCLAFLNF